MASPSPSQAFGYGQPGGGALGMGALSSQQPPRSLSNQQVGARFAAVFSQISGHVTPTSSGMPSFPTSLPNSLPPQQPSPNSLLSMSARVLPNQRPLGPDMKRMVSMANALGGLDPAPRPPGPISRSVGSMAGLSNFGMSHSSRGFSTQGLMGSGIPNSTSFASNPALDLSEFPTLTNRGPQESTSNPSILSNPTAGRPAYVGMVKQPTSESNEFQIHSEDFPALPGSQNHDNNQDNLNKSLVGNSSDSSKESGRFPGDKSNQNQKRGIQTTKDGRVTNIPAGMVTDQFGMVGLLTFIRVAETDPSLVSLALGSDLTTLGLNLNSPESLYQNFGGPWAEQPCRPQDIDFHVPSEYLINQSIREKLAPVKLNRYGEDLLFFLFYMFSGDLLQVAAAAELYNREWRYHKDEHVWISRAPGMVPTEKTSMYERGTYYFFDAVNWRKVAKEFHLDYERLEERPQLPQTLHYNPTQSSMMA